MALWKRFHNEGCNVRQCVRAACHAMVAHKGVTWAVEAMLEKAEVFASDAIGAARLRNTDMGTAFLLPRLRQHGGLVMAAFLGDSTTVRLLLREGSDPNEEHPLYGFPLYAAAYSGQARCAAILLDADADALESLGDMGMPIEVAAARGHVETVRLLADRNTDLGFSVADAAEYGREQVMELLLPLSRVNINASRFEDDNPVYLAIYSGNRNVAMLLAERPDLQTNRLSERGNTPLQEALDHELPDVAETLLARRDINPNVYDERLLTPLHIACEESYATVVRALLAREEIDPNLIGGNGYTCLSIAIWTGARSIITMLLEFSRVDASLGTCAEATPLVTAAAVEDVGTMSLLLRRQDVLGAENFQDSVRLALNKAAVLGNERIVRLLADTAPAVCYSASSHGWLLHSSVVNGSLEGVRLLMSVCGADVNSRCYDATPLMDAATYYRYDIAEFLLSRSDISVNLTGRCGTALCCAVRLPTKCRRIAQMLLDHPQVNPNIGPEGYTPCLPRLLKFGLRARERFGSRASQFYILEDLWSYRSVGPPPLTLAAAECSLGLASMLLKHPAIHPNSADEDGRTPLWFAVYSKGTTDAMVSQLLLHSDTDPNRADNHGWTPLFLAVFKNRVKMVDILLRDSRTDPNIANDDGCTPLRLATRLSRPHISGRLRQHPRIQIPQ